MKINDRKYNELYEIAELGLQNSWEDLGLSFDEINERANNNEKLRPLYSSLPTSYFLYQKNAQYIVNEILNKLGIEIEHGEC